MAAGGPYSMLTVRFFSDPAANSSVRLLQEHEPGDWRYIRPSCSDSRLQRSFYFTVYHLSFEIYCKQFQRCGSWKGKREKRERKRARLDKYTAYAPLDCEWISSITLKWPHQGPFFFFFKPSFFCSSWGKKNSRFEERIEQAKIPMYYHVNGNYLRV